MKEKISYHKGDNPLVLLPTIAACAAHLVLVMTLCGHLAPKERGFWTLVIILVLVFCSFFLIAMPAILIATALEYSEPAVVYVSKRTVRGVVSVAIASGLITLLIVTSSLTKPELKNFVDSLLLATSVSSAVLLTAHIAISLFQEATSKIKPSRDTQSKGSFLSPLLGLYGCLVLFLKQEQKIAAETGVASLALLTLCGISLLWFEEKKTSIADREIIPLCAASLLWMVSAFIANYAYASLASVTFVLPYLLYLLPLILLGIYYYVSSPEEA